MAPRTFIILHAGINLCARARFMTYVYWILKGNSRIVYRPRVNLAKLTLYIEEGGNRTYMKSA